MRAMGVLLRGIVSEEDALRAVARALAVPSSRVHTIEAPADDDVARVQLFTRERGFRTDLTVFVQAGHPTHLANDVALARLLAADLRQDAIASPEAAMREDLWVLVRPSSEMFFASSDTTESDDENIILDEAPDALKRFTL